MNLSVARPAALREEEAQGRYSDQQLFQIYQALTSDMSWAFKQSVSPGSIREYFFSNFGPSPKGSHAVRFEGVIANHHASGVIGIGAEDLARLRQLVGPR
jgi:hypothetical protein